MYTPEEETYAATKAEAVDIQVDTATAPEEDEDHVEFQIEASVLRSALSEANSGMDTVMDRMYFRVEVDEDADAYDQMMAPEAGTGRLLIGTMGFNRNYVFVDVPCISVTQPGDFLINEGEKIHNWAKETSKGSSNTLSVKHEALEGDNLQLRLSHGPGSKRLPLHILYDREDMPEFFPPIQDRFETPATVFDNDSLAEMLARAVDVAPSGKGSARTGDLMWRANDEDEDQVGEIEFVTVVPGPQHTVATSQRVPHASDIDLEWEVSPAHMKTLIRALKTDGATYSYDNGTRIDDDGEVYNIGEALRIAYEREEDDVVLYVHRQLSVERENAPLKDWSGDEGDHLLFEHPDCRLFATLTTERLFEEVRNVWAVDPSCMIQLQTDEREDESEILSLLSGDPADLDKTEISAFHGNSEVEQLLLHPEVFPMMEALLDDSSMLQLRTFPNAQSGGELPNAFVAIPLAAGSNPDEEQSLPGRYMIVSWH